MSVKMKSAVLIAVTLAFACAMSIGLTSCSADDFETNTETPAAATPDAIPSDTPAPAAAEPTEGPELVPFEDFACDLPAGYETPTDRPGEIHEETYTTYLYDNEGNRGEEVEATLYVYTPAGYDPGKQYNIIYLMHGSSDEAGYWLGGGPYAEGGERYHGVQTQYTTNVFEHMIADGRCGEAILVSPTFTDQFTSDAYFGGRSIAMLIRVSYQFNNDILPFVEAKYSTYAGGDVSDAGLIASRDHRAYAGLSLGSMIGFQAIWINCLEYFAYIGNFSGCDANDGSLAYAVAGTLNTKYADYDIKYWYNGNGTSDHLHDDHMAGYAVMLELCPDKFTEGRDYANGQNCIFVDKPGKEHTYGSWIVDFYNVMSIFFRVD